MRMLLALAVGLTLAALVVPVLASSAPGRQTDAITILQKRVSTLERTTISLKKQLAAQASISGTQSDRLTKLEGQVANPPKPKLTVTAVAGAPARIDYQNWEQPYALCPSGTTVIGGGYDTDLPIMVGRSRLGTSAPSWSLSVYNPYYQRPTVTPYATCLSLTP